MNKKGQALIEFILILPVILLILIALIDVGKLYMEKYKLNDSLNTASSLYQNNKTEELKAFIAGEKITFEKEENGDLVKIKVTKKVNINAIGLNKILGDDYKISAEKKVYKNE